MRLNDVVEEAGIIVMLPFFFRVKKKRRHDDDFGSSVLHSLPVVQVKALVFWGKVRSGWQRWWSHTRGPAPQTERPPAAAYPCILCDITTQYTLMFLCSKKNVN